MSLVIQGLEVVNIFYRYLVDKVNSKVSCDIHLSESTQATTPPPICTPSRSCSSKVIFSPDFSNDWAPKLEIMRRLNFHPSPKPHRSPKRPGDKPAADSGGAPENPRGDEHEEGENRLERLEEAEENEGQDGEENVPNGEGGGGGNGGDEDGNNNDNNNEENEEDDDIMPMEEGEMARTVARIRHVYGQHPNVFHAEALLAFLDIYEERMDEIQADYEFRLTEIDKFRILVEMYFYLYGSPIFRRYWTFPWREPALGLNNRNGRDAELYPELHLVLREFMELKVLENRMLREEPRSHG